VFLALLHTITMSGLLTNRVIGLCEHCVAGYELPGTPAGTEEVIGGKRVYVARSQNVDANTPAPTSTTTPKNAIVIVTDIFGLPGGNHQLIADQLAQELSADVYVPDIYDGVTPIPAGAMLSNLPNEPGQSTTIMDKLRFLWIVISHIPALWQVRNSALDATIHGFVKDLRAKNQYEKIGAIGYCLGGAAAVRLADTTLIDTVVIAHPGPVTKAQIKDIKVPASFICAEEDQFFTETKQNESEAEFAQRQDGMKYEFKSYKGTVHGFAARPNMSNTVVKKAFVDALDQTTNWFKTTL